MKAIIEPLYQARHAFLSRKIRRFEAENNAVIQVVPGFNAHQFTLFIRFFN